MARKQDIRLRRSNTAGAIPTAGNLNLGELAINTADGALYFKKGDGTIITGVDNNILHINSANKHIGINTTSPDNALHVKPTSTDGTNVVAKFESNDAQVWINLEDSGSGTYGALLGHDSDENTLFMVADANVDRKLVILDSGFVGIGNTNPGARLHVKSGTTNKVAVFESTDSTAFIQVKDNSTTAAAHGYGAIGNELVLYANDVGVMRIHNDGSVGVGLGSTNPSYTFQVHGTAGLSGDDPDFIQNITANSQSNLIQHKFAVGGTDKAQIYYNKADTEFSIESHDDITFRTGGSNKRATIDADGRVCIGVDSKYTTGGNAQLSINTSQTNVALTVGNSNNDLLYLRRVDTGEYQLQAYNSGNTGEIHLNPYGGNVGINTTTPGEALHVVGTIRTEGSSNTKYINVFGGNSGNFIDTYGNDLYFRVEDDTNKSLVLRNSGNVTMTGDLGVGTTEPGRQIHISDSGATVALKVEATDGNQASVDLQNSEGQFRIITDNGGLRIYDQTDTADRFRIDTNGNILLGKSSSNSATDGIELRASNQLLTTANNTTPLEIRRNGTAGPLIGFNQAGTAWGSISSGATSLSIVTTQSDITFTNSSDSLHFGSGAFRPFSADTGAIDLGSSSAKFKDLYLTGNVYSSGELVADNVSKRVATTATGSNGTENGANTWAKLATYSMSTDTSHSDASFTYAINGEEQGQPDAGMFHLRVRWNDQTGTMAPSVNIDWISLSTGTLLNNTAFKLISDGNVNSDIELWVQKVGNYGKLDLWEISYNKESVVDASYESDSAWQSAEPTATGSSAINYRSSAFKFDGKEVIIGDNYNNDTSILTTGQIRAGSLTGQSVMLNPNGSIELCRTDSSADPFIDFKNANADDFDARIQLISGNSLRLFTGGQGSTSAGITVDQNQATTLHATANIGGELNLTNSSSTNILDYYNSLFQIRSFDGTNYKTSIDMVRDGATKLRYNNVSHLETASHGVSITGPNGSSGTDRALHIIDATAANYGGHFTFADTLNRIEIGGITDSTKNVALSIERDETRVQVHGELRGPNSFTINPANNAGTYGDTDGTVIIKGDLQVDGTTTTINSTTLDVDDLNITLASGSANKAAANGAGITIDCGSDTNATITYDATNDRFNFDREIHTSNGIRIEQASPYLILKDTSDDDDHSIRFTANNNDNVAWIDTSTDDLRFRTFGSRGIHFHTGDVKRLDIHDDGNVRFYEDTGSDVRMKWDATNEVLTIGGGERLTLNPNIIINPNNGTSKTYALIKQNVGSENLALAMNGNDTTDRMSFFTDYGSSGTYDERLTIVAQTGRVGINEDAPQDQLHVRIPNLAAGTSNGLRISDDGSDILLQIRKDGSGNRRLSLMENGGNYPLALQEDGGRVGIGTTSPDYPLHVKAANNDLLLVENSSSSGTATIRFKPNSNRTGSAFIKATQRGSASDDTDIQIGDEGGTIATFGEAKVGINEDSPLGVLHIKNGDAGTFSANSMHDDLIVENSGSGGVQLMTTDHNTNTYYQYLAFGTTSHPNAGYVRYQHTAGTGNTQSDQMRLRVGSTDRVYIDANGRVNLNGGYLQENVSSIATRKYYIGSAAGITHYHLGKIEDAGDTDGAISGVIHFAYDYGTSTCNNKVHFEFAQRSGDARGTWWYEGDDIDSSNNRIYARLIDDGSGNMHVWITAEDYAAAHVEAIWRHQSGEPSGQLSSGTLTTGTTLFNTSNQPTAEMHTGNITIKSAGQLKFRGTNHYPRLVEENNHLDFYVNDSGNNTRALTINDNGNIGINNTQSPDYLLDLGGNTGHANNTIRLAQSNGGTAIRVGAGSGSGDITLLRIDGDSSGDNHKGETDSGAFGFSVKYMGASSGNENSLSIFTDNQQASSQIEAFTLLQDGKLGLNTLLPTEQLHVTGNIKGTGTVSTGAFILPNASGTSGQVLSWPSSGTTLEWTDMAGGTAGVVQDADGDTKIQVEESTDEDKIRFDTAGTQRMVITDDGKVGIGTDNPVQPLQVDGSIYSNGGEFFVNNNKGISAVGDLVFRTNDGSNYQTTMHLDGADNRVGIGTQSPGAKFHISTGTSDANGGVFPQMKLSDTNGTGDSNTMELGFSGNTFYFKRDDNDGAIRFRRTDNSDPFLFDMANKALGVNSEVSGFSSLSAKLVVGGNQVINTDTPILYLRSNSTGNASDIRFQTALKLTNGAGTTFGYFDNSGHLGLGTSSPSANGSKKTLHIDNSSNGSAIRLSQGSNSSLVRYDDTNGMKVGTIAEKALTLQTDDTDAVQISTAQNMTLFGQTFAISGNEPYIKGTGTGHLRIKHTSGNTMYIRPDENGQLSFFEGSTGGNMYIMTKTPTTNNTTNDSTSLYFQTRSKKSDGTNQSASARIRARTTDIANNYSELLFSGMTKYRFNEDVVVEGNLTVNGTQTVLNTSTLTVDDLNITVADGAADSSAADGAGLTVAGVNKSLQWDHANQYFEFNAEVYSPAWIIGTTATKVGRIKNNSGVFNIQAYTAREIGFGNDSNGEHVRIDANGNVGIGTTDPQDLLHLSADSPVLRLTNTSDSGKSSIEFWDNQSGTSQAGEIFFDDGGNLFGLQGNANGIVFRANNTFPGSELMRLTSGGSLGIGTNAPGALLHVSSGNSGDAVVIIESDADNNDESDNPQLMFKQDGGVTIAKAGLEGNAGGIFTGSLANAAYFGNDEAASVQFYTQTTARLTIDSNGKVGIGTATPDALLDLEGNFEGNSNFALRFTNTKGNGTVGGFRSHGVNGEHLTIYQNGARKQSWAGSEITFHGASDAEIVRFNNNGRVGIGETSPDHLLHVTSTENVVAKFETTHTDGNARILFKPTDNGGWNIGGNDNGNFTIYDVDGGQNSVTVETGAGGNTLVVDSNSRIGIGTAAPNEKLVVRAGNYASSQDGGIAVQMGAEGSSHWQSAFKIKSDASGNARTVIETTTGGTGGQTNDAIQINTGGEVGFLNNIGVNIGGNPGHRIHVQETGANNAAFFMTDSTSWLRLVPNLGGSGYNSLSTAGDIGIIFSTDNDNTTDHATNGLVIAAHAQSAAKGLKIMESGRIGIGTATPDRTLEVVFTGSTTGAKFTRGDTAGNSLIEFANTGGVKNVIGFDSGKAAYVVSTGSTDHLVIKNSTGKVGIGGVTDPKEALSIGNNINFHNGGHKLIAYNYNPSDSNHATVDNKYPAALRYDPDNGRFRIEIDATARTSGNASSPQTWLQVTKEGRVGIGNGTVPSHTLQVKDYGVDSNTVSTSATTTVSIFNNLSATTFRSARYSVQVKNTTDSTYMMTEILMIHDGTDVYITEYGTIFTGAAAEATFTADISGGNVRLKATPASTDAMTFKTVCHSILD